MPRPTPLLLLAALTVLLTGCGNVCDRMCVAQADMFERCFDDWGTTWAEEDYADRDAFMDRCSAVWGDALEDQERGEPEFDSLTASCEFELRAARADVDCDTVLRVDP